MLYEIENNSQVPQGIRSFAKASSISGAKELPAIQERSLAFKLTFQAGTPEPSDLLGSCKHGLSGCRAEN